MRAGSNGRPTAASQRRVPKAIVGETFILDKPIVEASGGSASMIGVWRVRGPDARRQRAREGAPTPSRC